MFCNLIAKFPVNEAFIIKSADGVSADLDHFSLWYPDIKSQNI